MWDEEEVPNFFEDHSNGNTGSNQQVSFMLSELMRWQLKYSVSDGCLLSLLKLIKVVLTTLNLVVNSQFLEEIIQNLPDSLHSMRRITGINRDDFDQYLVCPECHSIYQKEDILKAASGTCWCYF